MPRDGSGTMTTDTMATASAVASSTVVNSIITDIANAITDSINKDGTKAFAANQSLGGYKLTSMGTGTARTDNINLGQVQDGKANWADGGGTADAITATYSPAITALVDGQICFVRATAANATTTPTFAPNGLTARTIVKHGGVALAVGDIVGDGHELALRYDLSNTRWELLNPAVQAASSSASGLVELATVIETATGSDTTRAVTANGLNGLWGKLADIASAGTITVGAGGYAHVTGTTTITDIDFSTATNGRWAYIVFDGVLTLTHNATTLILPGGSDITTAAGDSALFIQDNADNIKCMFYQRADGTPTKASAVASSVSTSLGLPTTVFRVTDSSITTNTVLASDSTLKFAMLANTVYDFEAWLLLDVDADSGWKLGITGPAAPTEVFVTAQYFDDNSNNRGSSATSYTQLDANTPGADRNACITIKGLIRNGANAGDFALQFAQNVSHATAFIIKRGSRLSYRVNA